MQLSNLYITILISLLLVFCQGSLRGPRQIAKLNYRLESCFGYMKYDLIIVEKDSSTIVTVYNRGMKSLSQVLDKKKLERFQKFVSELKAIENGGECTTTEYYVLSYSGEKIIKKDGNCAWEGFSKMYNDIFGVMPY